MQAENHSSNAMKGLHQSASGWPWEELTGPLQQHMLPHLPARSLAMLRQASHVMHDLVDVGTGYGQDAAN